MLLQEFGIEDLIDIPISLKLSIKTTSQNLKKELIDQARAHLKTLSLKPFLEVFVIPWMRGRFGLATKKEVLERLCNVSEEFSSSCRIVPFLEQVVFPLELPLLTEELYTVDLFARQKILEIETIAKTYFYTPFVVYPLETLVGFILNELSFRFIFATSEEVGACLKYLKTFRVRRNKDQRLICHLS